MAALVIGYGNPLRQDDGLGWEVAARLRAEDLPGVDVVACHQLTPELAEPISRAERVIFVDICQGAEPGRVKCRPLTPDSAAELAFSHQVRPGALLHLARELYGACPPAWVVTVDGAAFGYHAALSPLVLNSIPVVVGCVIDRCTPPGAAAPLSTFIPGDGTSRDG
jgi:hydrogenase maturation protease